MKCDDCPLWHSYSEYSYDAGNDHCEIYGQVPPVEFKDGSEGCRKHKHTIQRLVKYKELEESKC